MSLLMFMFNYLLNKFYLILSKSFYDFQLSIKLYKDKT